MVQDYVFKSNDLPGRNNPMPIGLSLWKKALLNRAISIIAPYFFIAKKAIYGP